MEISPINRALGAIAGVYAADPALDGIEPTGKYPLIESLHDEDKESACQFTYVVQFKRGRVLHAVETEGGSLGVFTLDQIFSGGFSISCGKVGEGEATISRWRYRAEIVTCKKCRTALALL